MGGNHGSSSNQPNLSKSGPAFFDDTFFQSPLSAKGLAKLDVLQGQSIPTIKFAQSIANQQLGFIQDALTSGFALLNKDLPHPLLANILKYFVKKDSLAFDSPATLFSEQQALYEEVHQSSRPDTEKLFYEFLFGLARFDLATQVIFRFADYLAHKDPYQFGSYKTIASTDFPQVTNGHDLFERLNALSVVAESIIDKIVECYCQNEGLQDYWQLAHEFFSNNPTLKLLTKHLVSMQYIPDNIRFLGIAQTLHWNGFGGNGKVLKSYPQLHTLLVHAIGYHRKQVGDELFSQRLTLFKDARSELMEHVGSITAAAIAIQFSSETLKIYDVCSGPSYAGVEPIVSRLKGRNIELTITDVDGSSLAGAVILKKNQSSRAHPQIKDVRYEDLTLTLKARPEELGSYHLVSAGIGFHQLPQAKINEALRYLTSLATPGGFVINPDVSDLGYLQLMLIPANIVDREGLVHPAHQLDLNRVTYELSESEVKVPYPLRRLRQDIPQDLAADDAGSFYGFDIYVVIKMPTAQFQQLNSYWNSKTFELADKLASNHLQGCDSVDALQSKIMAAASNLRSSTLSAGYSSA